MRQEKLKPLTRDILLSAGISITDRCSISPSILSDSSSNHSRNYVPCTLGHREDWWETMPPATSQQPGNSSLFPLPLWQIRGCGKGSCLASGFAPAGREAGGRPTSSLFCEAAHNDSFFFFYCFVSVLFHQTHSKQAFCLPLMKSASISKVLFAGCSLSPSPI